MGLPRIEAVRYTTDTIKEIGKKVDYRQFTVKEHKLLLASTESGESQAVINTIRDLVDKCTFKKLDLDTLPMYVVDLLYLKIHGKSTGNVQEAIFTCRKELENGEFCNTQIQMPIDVDKVQVEYPDDYQKEKVVMLTETAGITLRAPNFEEYRKFESTGGTANSVGDDFICACIKNVFDGDEVGSPGVDFSNDELLEWLGELEGSVLQQVSDFFSALPYIHLEQTITCSSCGNKETVDLRGLSDFFE